MQNSPHARDPLTSPHEAVAERVWTMATGFDSQRNVERHVASSEAAEMAPRYMHLSAVHVASSKSSTRVPLPPPPPQSPRHLPHAPLAPLPLGSPEDGLPSIVALASPTEALHPDLCAAAAATEMLRTLEQDLACGDRYLPAGDALEEEHPPPPPPEGAAQDHPAKPLRQSPSHPLFLPPPPSPALSASPTLPLMPLQPLPPPPPPADDNAAVPEPPSPNRPPDSPKLPDEKPPAPVISREMHSILERRVRLERYASGVPL